jgi:integrase
MWYQTKPVRITLGIFPSMSIEQARGKAREHKATMSAGIDPAEEKRKTKQEMTFGELFEIYLDRHAKPRKRTWREDVRIFKQYLKPLENKRLSTITRSNISVIHGKIGREYPITANRVLALISSVFGRGIEYSFYEDMNPCRGIRKFSERSRDRFLQADELPRFFKSLNAEPNTTVRDYILISLLTGARRSNVLEMRWGEVDLEQGTWKIPVTKSGDPQTVTLSVEAVEILRTRKREATSIFVFPGHGRTGHLVEPKSAWKRILERAGIKDLRIHDLRRTLGSWQAITGASLPIIGKSLSHKNASTTQIYARLNLDPVRLSVQKAVSAMFELGNKE